MYWLVLFMYTGYPSASAAMMVLPEKYPTEQECKVAAGPWQYARQNGQGQTYVCIPAPVPTIDDKGPVIKDFNGRICRSINTNAYSGKYICE